jgi:molecular chaperone HscA
LSPEDARLLMMRCREAKEFLTNNPEAPIRHAWSTGEMVDLKLTTATFAEIAQTPLVPRPAAGQEGAARCRPAARRGDQGRGHGRWRDAHAASAAAVGDFLRPGTADQSRSGQGGALGAATQANLLAGNKTARTTGCCST